MSYTVIKMLFQWDPERICNLTAACIRQGYHPKAWRTARGVVIPKPGKPDYSQARAHRVISLLNTMGKLVERTAAHLISERLEMNHHLHDGQYGGRVRRSTIDAVAVLINQTQLAWEKKAVAGALLMDVKSAFNNVSKSHLATQMNRVGIDPQLIRWSLSFMDDRRMIVELNRKSGLEHQLDSGIPQGSPVSPILFAIYMSELFDDVEEKMENRVRALSFVDDIAWWTSAKDAAGVRQHLTEAAAYALEWAHDNAVTFDTEKTEAIWLSRKRKIWQIDHSVQVGSAMVNFNKSATKWLGMWIDSALTFRQHQHAMLKNARNAQARLRRLAGKMGLVPDSVRRTQVACVQAVALYGSELWWRGEAVYGSIGKAADLQKLVNQQARAVTGCFRSTNQGELMLESGLRCATSLLNNRGRRFALRLASLPQGDGAGDIIGGKSELGKRLTTWLGLDGESDYERTVVCEEEVLPAEIAVNDRKTALEEAESPRDGLTLWTDGSRTEDGACGYGVVWMTGGGVWKGQKVHLGYNQEAYDAECAAIVRALRIGRDRRKQHRVPKITIFTDAQAAIKRMKTLEVGPGQIFALQARRILAEIDCPVEIRWCPAHEGIAGNEEADQYAKIAAEKPHERGVEWLTIDNRTRRMPPASLAHLSRQIAEKKWVESKNWAYSRITNPAYNVKCRPWRRNCPDPGPAKTRKATASRYYQLKTGHALTGQYLKWIGSKDDDMCWWCHQPGVTQTREHLFKVCTTWKKQQKILWKAVRLQTKRGRDRFRIADLFADERCTEAILEFLETTDVGRKAREEEWEYASDGTTGMQEEVVEGEEESTEVEGEIGGGL
jgi:ribonuclease HI